MTVMKLKKYIFSMVMVGMGACLTTSCDDMLDLANDNIMSATAINNESQTASYVLGIIKKMQAVGVRTNVLGEVRGDLVTTNDYASTDMKDIANFDFSNEEALNNNRFNQPSDYYAIINQCNHFLANVDTAKISSVTGKSIFASEQAQVKYYRAWAYMQLGMIYGDNIPFLTEPVIDQESALNSNNQRYSFAQILDFLKEDINDELLIKEKPSWGNGIGIGNADYKMLFHNGYIVKGDIYLWSAVLKGKGAGEQDAMQAAKYYYKYLQNSKPRVLYNKLRLVETHEADKPYMIAGIDAVLNLDYETVLLMDNTTLTGDGYNMLCKYYNYDESNMIPACVVPSAALDTMSTRTEYCGYYDENGKRDTVYSDLIKFSETNINNHYKGDLRRSAYTESSINSDKVEKVYNAKNSTESVQIGLSRTTDVWLKFAEALNYAGCPYYSNAILSYGVNEDVVNDYVVPRTETSKADFVKEMALFNNISRGTTTMVSADSVSFRVSTILDGRHAGVHSNGAGFTQLNKKYFQEPVPTEEEEINKPVAPKAVPYPGQQPIPVKKPEASYTYFKDTLFFAEHCQIASGKRATNAKTATLVTPPYYKPLDVNSEAAKDFVKVYHDTPEDKALFLDVYSWHTYRNAKMNTRDANPIIADKPMFMPLTYEELATLGEAKSKDYQKDVLDAWTKGLKINPNDVLKYEQYQKDSAEWEANAKAFAQYLEEREQYEQDIYNWNCKLRTAHLESTVEQMDSLILAEQALENAFEGKRYYELMRRALWNKDASYLADPISRRNTPNSPNGEILNKLMDQNNWFLKWSDGAGSVIGPNK